MGKIYQILVKGLRVETTTIDISHSEEEFNEMKILTLKQKLLEKLPHKNGSDLRLLFANDQLEDNKTFSDYKLKDKSTIMMVLRLPGGER
ncbi:polyubiquitin [Hypanus sabinus]|uniref:polyubiquitin n=1 Tax=Hypanus sabinus TaxID=79690 RepID=UPI0028C40B05|nr:polyubiquitin [Hypanus sabinus]